MLDRLPFTTAPQDALRAKLLDALRAELDVRPWGEVTMADVARAAGVSRQTLYREFGSRRELGQACVLREADRFLAGVEDAVRAHAGDPDDALAAAFDAFLALAEGNPLVVALVSTSGSDELLPFLTVEGGPVLEGAVARLGSVLRGTWPELDPDDVVLLAESVVRLSLSHLSTPAGPARMTGASVAALLGPFLRGRLHPA